MKVIRRTNNNTVFTSDRLNVGDMMEADKNNTGISEGDIILRTSNRYVNLSNPLSTWPIGAIITGKKLSIGDTIILIQE